MKALSLVPLISHYTPVGCFTQARLIEAFKEAEDHHTQQLKDIYLVTRARRRIVAMEDGECPILDGIPIATMEGKIVDTPPAPPPTEASLEIG